jgi:hypothetical protein
MQLPPREPRKLNEGDLTKLTIEALCKVQGVRARRNNVGKLPDARGVWVHYGLGEGSPDIVGVISIGGMHAAFPARSRMYLAVAFGVEMKTPKTISGPNQGRTPEQVSWHDSAAQRCMRVWTCDSPDSAVTCVREYIDHLQSVFG